MIRYLCCIEKEKKKIYLVWMFKFWTDIYFWIQLGYSLNNND